MTVILNELWSDFLIYFNSTNTRKIKVRSVNILYIFPVNILDPEFDIKQYLCSQFSSF